MPKASPIRAAFNAGELSPLMDGRVDIAKYQNGCRICQNFIPSVQGPAVRRAGTRFVHETKDSSARSWLVPFEFSNGQAYVLEFGHLYIRFYTNHGQLLSSAPIYDNTITYKVGDVVVNLGVYYCCLQDGTNGTDPPNAAAWYPLTASGNVSYPAIYEIPTVFTAADLTASDGTLALDYVQSGDVVYITHPSHPPQKLCRWSPHYGSARWSIGDIPLTNGPFKDQNIDRSSWIAVSGLSGSVTLTSSQAIFQPGMVGSFIYLEPADLSTIKPWTAGQEFTVNPFGKYRRSDGKTYQCMTNGTPTAGGSPANVWRTGGNKPIHTYGVEADGAGNAIVGTNVEKEGLSWKFIDSGYGHVKITGYTSPFQVTAVVQGQSSLPRALVPATQTVGITNGSTNVTGVVTADLVVGMLVTGTGIPAGTTIATIVSGATNITLSAAATVTNASASITFTPTTFRYAFAAFSGTEGYPSHVTFFRERLCFNKGIKLYFSVAGDFENFAQYDDSGLIVADRSISVTISSDQVNEVQWLSPAQVLLIGTSGAEFACQENSANDAFAPGNVKIEQQTADGASGALPVNVGYSTLFIQRSGRKVKEVAFNLQQNGYVTSDMAVLAEHITQGGIIQIAWHKEPYVAMWGVRSDGVLLGFTFNKEQDVIGWHRHPMTNGQVESVCVIPAPDQSRDDLWLIVKRTINGVTKRYVEYLEREYQTGDTMASAFYVDCGATYSGSPATVISGLDYLEGQWVQVLTDGAEHPDRQVTGGSITLQLAASKIQVGLGYSSILQTNRIEAGAADGTAQGKMKRINKAVFRFFNTLGASVGPDESTLDDIQFRSAADHMDAPPPLFSGDKLVEWPDGYNFEGYIMVKQARPLPMTVVAIMPQVHTFDR